MAVMDLEVFMLEVLGIETTFMPLLVAVILGGLFGIERQIHGRWAGFRTHMMVSMGAAMFVIAALGIMGDSNEDVSRVIQGVAAGVGFIGAGTILKLGTIIEVKGLTTASTIWVSSAVGTACGLGNYRLACWATLLSVVVLAVLRPIEKYFQHGGSAAADNE